MVTDGVAQVLTPTTSSPPAARYFRQVGVMIRADTLAELRTRETPVAMVVFALLVLLIFSFAFDLRPGTPPDVLSGVLWSAILFSGMLGLGRGFATERERGTLDGLLLAPVDRSAIYLARLADNLLLMFIMEAVTLPATIFFFNIPVWRPALLLTVFLGTLAFAIVGTLFAVIAASSRARDVLLPVLLLPVSVPIVIASVEQTAAVLSGPTLLAAFPWTRLTVGYAVLFFIMSMLLFEHVLEE
ncbi:MAG: heme exporter protein CcmB [Chloroflexota bacterium]